jgi:hypothetical protein
MSGKDRRLYLTSPVLNQTILDWCHDNLECKLEVVAEIETPTGTIYASDRNKYVGNRFYEALLVFPVINRTVGDWLTPELSFSTLTIELSNADGRFNDIMPAGINYGSWVGKSIIIKLGLAEVESSYKTIYSGTITEVGGVKRSVKSITLISRDRYDKLSAAFPTDAITRAAFPKVQDDVAGKLKPVIYGDFTTALAPNPAIVTSFITNGRDPFVTFKEVDLDITIAPSLFESANHAFDEGDPVQLKTGGTLPTGVVVATTYYIKNATTNTFQLSAAPFGAAIVLSGTQSGSHTIVADPTSAREAVQLLTSANDLVSFDASNVWMRRSDFYYRVSLADVTTIGAGNRTFHVEQNTLNLWFNGAAYLYESGDIFFVRVKGKNLAGYDDNLVSQAKDILKTYGGLVDGDFDGNWATYRDKSSPAQSNIAGIKSRVWIAEPQQAITYALSMMEQVRLEAFISRDQLLKINSLHFEDFQPSPTFDVKNWDVVKDSFTPQVDEINNFNRAQGSYDLHPDTNENSTNTPIFKNEASIAQVGKAISKKIIFPNLYIETDVTNNLQEIIRLSSAMFETIALTLTWRAMLLDVGDFILVNVVIGSAVFENVPVMIRTIGADSRGLTIPIKAWSFSLCPFPGYVPAYSGTVGGYAATIIQE